MKDKKTIHEQARQVEKLAIESKVVAQDHRGSFLFLRSFPGLAGVDLAVAADTPSILGL